MKTNTINRKKDKVNRSTLAQNKGETQLTKTIRAEV